MDLSSLTQALQFRNEFDLCPGQETWKTPPGHINHTKLAGKQHQTTSNNQITEQLPNSNQQNQHTDRPSKHASHSKQTCQPTNQQAGTRNHPIYTVNYKVTSRYNLCQLSRKQNGHMKPNKNQERWDKPDTSQKGLSSRSAVVNSILAQICSVKHIETLYI